MCVFILFSYSVQPGKKKSLPPFLLVILDCTLGVNAECSDRPEVSHRLPPAL